MFTNRVSGHFEQLEKLQRAKKPTAFTALPVQLPGRPQPFSASQDLYRYAYECAKAELLNKLVTLLRSRWDLIHVTGSDLTV